LVVAPSPPGETGLLRRVRRLYHLTETEARVMVGLASGATVDDIATRHGVRASTVRAQVRSLFDKTGVNRQSDLVRLALTGTRPVAGNGWDV
jgi:DNA-binding CsgD family transcriptional regulator